MFPKTAGLMALAALAALGGCERRPDRSRAAAPAALEQASYAAPPSVSLVRLEGGGVRLSGQAPPGAQVRLGTPEGAAATAQADAAGRWSLGLPPAAQTRIFGLSANVAGRQVQGQGYVVLTAKGPAAQLRAGAGALRLDPRPTPSLGALDFDRAGAAIVSGRAPAGSVVFLSLDGRQVDESRADAAGAYAIALSRPIARGAHTLQASGDGFANTAMVELAPASPLAAGPMRSQLSKGGVRIDWMTPGGGLQSTILLD
ncbi:MAG TPA: hypothetical protein VHV27_00765 [Phenylobacterium sp.]|nr:hypothetical protein [Phenylobacterium sp.]